MENEIQDFTKEYIVYGIARKRIELLTLAPETNTVRISGIYAELRNLDVKMRLAFGISQIVLNNAFVDDKQGDLRDCHLYYYKLADLWFAYETYHKLFSKVSGVGRHNILWLDTAVHKKYFDYPAISNALNQVNSQLEDKFNSVALKNQLAEYLTYCQSHAINTQKVRLGLIAEKVLEAHYDLTHTQALTIIYAIRNNFVHNGETTVVPDIFGFRNKSRLLQILYPYLCILLVCSANITCEEV